MVWIRTVLLGVIISMCGGPLVAATWIVDQAGYGDFIKINDAVISASVSDTILVRPGTYVDVVKFFPDKGGILLKGDGSVESIIVSNDTVAVSVVGTVLPVRIENLTLMGSRLYGALYILEAKAEVIGCVVRDNVGPGGCNGVGGGGRIELSDVLVEGCIFENNNSWESPGGLIIWSSRADIRNNVFRGNSACYGGGLQFYHCEGRGPSVVEGNLFLNNEAYDWGGGIFNADSSPEIRYNTFSENGGEVGSAIWVLGGSPYIHHNIFVDSYEVLHCQSLTGYPESTPVFEFNLCWNISRFPLPGCAVMIGTIKADPLFCDVAGGNFGLCEDSPAVEGDETVYGAFDVECEPCGEVPVEDKNWGEIKSLFK